MLILFKSQIKPYKPQWINLDCKLLGEILLHYITLARNIFPKEVRRQYNTDIKKLGLKPFLVSLDKTLSK